MQTRYRHFKNNRTGSPTNYRRNRRITRKNPIGPILKARIGSVGKQLSCAGQWAMLQMGILWSHFRRLPWRHWGHCMVRAARIGIAAADLPRRIRDGARRTGRAAAWVVRNMPLIRAGLVEGFRGRVLPSIRRFHHMMDPGLVCVIDPAGYRVRMRRVSITYLFLFLFGLFAIAISLLRVVRVPSAPENYPTAAYWTGKNSDPLPHPDPEPKPDVSLADRSVATDEPRTVLTKDRPANFFSPLYVFIESPSSDYSVYPLASPPGIVVDIRGAVPPEASAEEMVGEDDRIVRIRRLERAGGLRYILHLNSPVRRLETVSEGNVITVNPLS